MNTHTALLSTQSDATLYLAEQLRQGEWFKQLHVDFQHELLQHAICKKLKRDEYLFQQHHAFNGLYCLISGSVLINHYHKQGKESLLMILTPGHWFGEISLIDGLNCTHNAVTKTDVEVVWIPAAAMQAILLRHPIFWRDIACLSVQRLRCAFIELHESSVLPTFQRVVRRLISINQFQQQPGQRAILTLRQEHLANMLGISRQTINQILKELEALKLIQLSYRSIEILNFAALAQLTEQP